MAIPLFMIAAQGAVRLLTSPQFWKISLVSVGALFALNFVVGNFLTEAVSTVTSLWWVVGLIALLGLARATLPTLIREREKTKRKLGKASRKE